MYTIGSFGDTASDVERGTRIMQQFYNYASGYPGFQLSFDDFLAKYTAKSPSFLESLGFAATAAEMTESATEAAMAELARRGQGQIPANWNAFFSALQDRATQVNLWDAAVYTVKESATDVGTGLEKVGETALEVGKTALSTAGVWKYALYALPLVVVLALYARFGGRFGGRKNV